MCKIHRLEESTAFQEGEDAYSREVNETENSAPTQDKMVGWHHRLNGHEFDLVPGGAEGQGSLVCCPPWGGEELDTAERLNNNSSEIKVICGAP